FSVEIERAASDSVRWRRSRLGLGVTALGFGVGLAVLDLLPGRTRGVLAWYNPLMVGGSIGLVVALWWLWGRKLTQAQPGRDGFVSAAWRLLPLGALPLWGMVNNSANSPWGCGTEGPAHFIGVLLCVAAAGTIGLCWVAAQGLRRLPAAATAGAVESGPAADPWETSAGDFLSRLTWLIWPVILFAMVYERNLRLLEYSALGIPFDFMHWGEWWGPWWELTHDPQRKLWVDVFPIHGVGCDILPCWLAAACGDATLAGRFQVTAFLNAASFVCFYTCLVSISRRKSVALLAVLVIVWQEPSWFNVWLSDHRFLPLYLWVLAALAVGCSLRQAGFVASDQPGAVAPTAGKGGLIASALALGLLPLLCFLTSVDVGYVTLVATGVAALALLLFSGRFSLDPASARLAGGLAGLALVVSCAAFLVWLGDRRGSFLAYHAAVFQAKGAFDFLPLGYADELNLVKGLYVFGPPVAVMLAALAAFVRRGNGGPHWQFGPLAVALVAALYFKKGLDRADTAHFEQAAVLTPVLLAFLISTLDDSAGLFRKPALGVLIGGVLLVWVGAQQGVDSLASHPALSELWGGQALKPETNLALARDRVGALRCASDRFLPVAETLAYIETRTRPEDCIYDFTNSGLWPFLANRGNAARYSQTFHAMSREMQEQVIADLALRKPVLVLFPDQRTTVDFVDLTLRQHWITAWLLEHYTPVAHAGYYVVLTPRDPAWCSKGPVASEPGAAPRPGEEWAPRPDPNFNPAAFIWPQDQGFLPRAFGAEELPGPATLVAECAPGTVELPANAGRDVRAVAKDLRVAWLFEATGPEPSLHIPLPKPLLPGDADWMEVEFAASAGTGGAVAFDSGPAEPLAKLQQWWRRVLFKIEPVKRAAQSRRYRFHLAAMPAWMFQPAPVQAIDLQTTDTAGTTFAVDRIRFWKDSQP
ncbi:MAG TPA: hypothetical protein VL860_12825, partial [Planctomycetota bacterium]|nr:hypothetical protein [Planctomycetota bacterium]